jgi:flagellar biosynthetic protein FliR
MDVDVLVRLGLVLARPGMLIAAAPVFGGHFAPPHVRVGLAMMLSFILMPVVDVPPVATLAGIVMVIARELAIGLAMALGIRALITGAELGGHLAGSQLMLSYGSVIDPQGGVRNTVLATLYGNLALLTFFAVNGHHALVRALTASYAAIPIGTGAIDASLATSVMRLLGLVFTFGLRLAAPVVIVMLIVEIATGLISKAAPAINLMVVGTPIRLIVGLLAVAAVIPMVPQLSSRFATLATEIGLQAARAFR